ncbi:probable methyltransferase PMT27 isoform X2 [Telopea speciosissima]|uniref:probable methyltransferase PMT27 isoform X2 n=1 Tax=Telopea speciosissima TaxID=54955 RepID=UPI001CC3519A|nr:probable methyltransferase PMT27 isoform X2 [Telopea speciosissima]
MAIGRGRSTKRSSSSSSYIPTVSTIIFIVLCVFGLWMLSSTIVPQQTTRTSNSGFIKSERQRRDPPAFDDTPGDLPDDAVKDDADKSKAATSTTHYDEKLQEEKQSVLLLPGRRSDPTITNTKAATTETEGNVDGEIQQQEKSSLEDGKKNYEATSDANEEKDQSFSSSTEENPQAQERRDSVEDGQQKKQEIQEENNENQQQNQEAQKVITENQQGEAAQTGVETEETQATREEESNGSQDQQQTTEMEREEKIHQQNQQDTEGDHNQESQQQQNSEDTNNEGDSIHGDHQNLESGIKEVTTDETQQQDERGTPESQTTEGEHPQQNGQGESTSESTENQETQQQQQKPQHQQQSESENQEPQQERQSESTATEIENQEIQQQSELESTPLLKNQEAGLKENQEESQQNDQRESEREEETGTKQENNDSETTDKEKEDSKMGIPKESKESKREWATQATQSENEKERRKESDSNSEGIVRNGSIYGYTWQLCNVNTGPDYIPCLDNEDALKHLHTTGHFEHRERHCPEEGPTCLVPIPQGYKSPIEWPSSRDKIWYHNVPHTKLAEVKGHQNWVKVTGEFLTFPGGGTQFIHGALHYIDFIQQSVPRIAWGKHTRVILDVGCGVASFGGYLFDRDVLTMSFAPKDEHEAQVQFALERGIPAISAVMGSQRLPFPSRVFDLIHCARCRVPWHIEGGRLLLELNRVLRPGGFFVWSATPVYQKLKEDVKIWEEMTSLTISMCWDLYAIRKDKLNSVAAAIYRKPISNDCYDRRKHKNPPMCKHDDDPNAAWYVPLQSCMHRAPIGKSERGSRWPEDWPTRLQQAPYWLNNSQMGIYGNPAPNDFEEDYKHWKQEVNKLYLNGLGINWSKVRNIMDMRAVYGGFAGALKDLKVWVMNVVNVDSPDTLPIIYERGLFGIYHDWCESFSTYPRTFDLLHADHLFSKLMKRCKVVPVMAEIDRIIRPGGNLIVRDDSSTVDEIENILKSLHWEVHYSFSKDKEAILSAEKSDWRPES